MKDRQLPKRQGQLFEEIRNYISKNNESPTVEELRIFMNVSSSRTISDHLDVLEKKGYIVRDKNKKRNIRIREEKLSLIDVPVVASAGCDHAEIFAQEEFEGFLSIEPKMLQGCRNVVAIRAIGDSMQNANIDHGDYVLTEVTNYAENGDRVVALLGDIAVIKKLRRTKNVCMLDPEAKGSDYKHIVMSDDSSIFGRVINVVKTEDEEPLSEMVTLNENERQNTNEFESEYIIF